MLLLLICQSVGLYRSTLSYDPLRGSLSCHERLNTLFLHWYEIIRLSSRGVQMMIKVFTWIPAASADQFIIPHCSSGRRFTRRGLRCSSCLHSLVVLFRPDLCINGCIATVAIQMNAIFLLNAYCETKGKVSILDELNMAKKSQAKHTSGLRKTRAVADEERKNTYGAEYN